MEAEMASKKKTNEVAVVEENLPAVVMDYGEDAGDGLQTVGQDEVGIPLISIMQEDSGPVTAGQSTEKMFFNSGTGESYESILFVPATRQHLYAEFVPRKKGGGFRGNHAVDSDIVRAAIDASDEFGSYKTPEGNELKETFYVFGMILDPQTEAPVGMACVPFSSSAIPEYKKTLMNRIRYCMVDTPEGRKINPPMYAHRVVLGIEKKHKNNDEWWGFDIKFKVENNVLQSLIGPDHPAYEAAKGLKAAIDGGTKTADFGGQENAGRSEADGGSAF
jgi:hypothetical protein